MDKEILQRIIFISCLLSLSSLYAKQFQRFVSLVIVDTFTGAHENILLKPGKAMHDEKSLFHIKVKGIEPDEENSCIAWVDLEICYIASKVDMPICIQQGKLCTDNIYRFKEERYLFAFDVSTHLDEE